MSNLLVYTTPKESNVYSKSVCRESDPFGVEPIWSMFFYRRSTLSGSNKIIKNILLEVEIQSNLKGLRYE